MSLENSFNRLSINRSTSKSIPDYRSGNSQSRRSDSYRNTRDERPSILTIPVSPTVNVNNYKLVKSVLPFIEKEGEEVRNITLSGTFIQDTRGGNSEPIAHGRMRIHFNWKWELTEKGDDVYVMADKGRAYGLASEVRGNYVGWMALEWDPDFRVDYEDNAFTKMRKEIPRFGSIICTYRQTPKMYNLQYIKDYLLYVSREELQAILDRVKIDYYIFSTEDGDDVFVFSNQYDTYDPNDLVLERVNTERGILSFGKERQISYSEARPRPNEKILRLYSYTFFYSPNEQRKQIVTSYVREGYNNTFYYAKLY